MFQTMLPPLPLLLGTFTDKKKNLKWMGFLYKYDESKVWMQNAIKELFLQTPKKFPLGSLYGQWQTKPKNFF